MIWPSLVLAWFYRIIVLIYQNRLVPSSSSKVTLRITTEFEWNDKVHGNSAESFWIWVEDPDNQTIYHSEYLMIEKKKVRAAEDARKRGKL